MLGALLGKGNTADVFDAGHNKVVKLFRNGYPLTDVRHEFENSKRLDGLDLPVVRSHELVAYEGRHGILYDRISGKSMLEWLLHSGDVGPYAAALASLHKEMLACKLPGAVSLKSVLKRNIGHTVYLSQSSKSNLHRMVDALPDGDCFCHGDFHFGNVIVEGEKKHIIDYMNVCQGHEYGDIARTVYLIEMTPVPAHMHDDERLLLMKKRAAEIYLSEMGVCREGLSPWLTVTAAARLSELSDEEEAEKNSVLDYLSAVGA